MHGCEAEAEVGTTNDARRKTQDERRKTQDARRQTQDARRTINGRKGNKAVSEMGRFFCGKWGSEGVGEGASVDNFSIFESIAA